MGHVDLYGACGTWGRVQVEKIKMKPGAKVGRAKDEKGPDRMNVKRFLLVYLCLMAVFFFFIASTTVQKVIDLNGIYTHWIVIVSAKIIGAMGIPCEHQGSIIRISSMAMDIKFGCNGLEAVLIYSVAVIAFPSSWRKKIVGIIAGFVTIQAVNLLRIAALAYSGIHFRTLFEYVHIYVAQGIMIAIALGVFFVYMDYANRKTPSL